MGNKTVKFNYEISTENGEFKTGSYGQMELDIEKLKAVQKICFEWGYSLTDLITFFIENLNEDAAEQLLSTMECCVDRSD